MANVTVAYEDMRAAATRLTSMKDEIDGKLAESQAFIQNLIQSGFVTDAASKAFGEANERFTTSARTVNDTLMELSAFLNNAATAMENTDIGLAGQLG